MKATLPFRLMRPAAQKEHDPSADNLKSAVNSSDKK